MNATITAAMGETQTVTLKDGRTLRYTVTASAKPPLLLMHTIRTQLEYFQYVLPALSQHFTVYALDLPGHGQSSIERGMQYDEPYLRSGVIGFIEALNLVNLTIAGESIGGVLALTVAAALPERIKSVVSSNPYDYDQKYGDGVRRGNFVANFLLGNFAIPVHGAIFAALENKLLLGLIMRGGLKARKAMPPELLGLLDRNGRRKGYRYVERNVFENWHSWGVARQWYERVKAPVTLVYGDGDWSTGMERQRTAQALHVKPHVLSETGHFAFVDRPDALATIIIDQASV